MGKDALSRLTAKAAVKTAAEIPTTGCSISALEKAALGFGGRRPIRRMLGNMLGNRRGSFGGGGGGGMPQPAAPAASPMQAPTPAAAKAPTPAAPPGPVDNTSGLGPDDPQALASMRAESTGLGPDASTYGGANRAPEATGPDAPAAVAARSQSRIQAMGNPFASKPMPDISARQNQLTAAGNPFSPIAGMANPFAAKPAPDIAASQSRISAMGNPFAAKPAAPAPAPAQAAAKSSLPPAMNQAQTDSWFQSKMSPAPMPKPAVAAPKPPAAGPGLVAKAANTFGKQANGLLTRMLSGAARVAPKVDSFIGNAATRGGQMFHKALHAKPKSTLFATGLGLGGLNDLASSVGAGFGKWDPAAHAERMDPKVTGWGAAAHTYAHPLQSLIGGLGLAGKKAPISVGQQGQAHTPTNLRFGPGGEVMGTQAHDVQMELSPKMQAALDMLRGGDDAHSVLSHGLADAGMEGGGLLSGFGGGGGRQQVSAPKPAPRPYYADPRFMDASVTSPAAGQFLRSF